MATTSAQLEQELRLMIKTLTNLGYSEWTSISDIEVRSGAPRVYCSFLRYLLEDCHPRVLQMLLSAKTADGDLSQQQRINRLNPAVRACSESRQHPAFHNSNNRSSPGNHQRQPLQRSSINKFVASTVGFHAPAHNFSSCASVSGPSFIIEEDDTKFMQRLLQHVLPEHFAITAPMSPHQFFRASGGFVLQKAKLVRNVAALFARREEQLLKEEQNRVDVAQHTKMLMERSARHRIMKQCGVNDDLAYLEFEPKPLIDDKNGTNYAKGGGLYSNLTSRQKVELAERQKKAEVARRLDAIRERERQLNEIAHRTRKVYTDDEDANRQEYLAAKESPLTLLVSPPRSANVINKQIEEQKLAEANNKTKGLLLDQAKERGPRVNEELVEEGVCLVSPSRRK